MNEELEQYHQKGGTYVIPVEIINYWTGEYEDLKNQVEKLTQENNDLESKYQIKNDEYIKATLKICDLQEEIEHLKQPQIFIDTEDMEERYGNDLYVEYLEKEKEHLQSVIDKALNKIDNMFNNCDEDKVIDDLLELDKILRSKDE